MLKLLSRSAAALGCAGALVSAASGQIAFDDAVDYTAIEAPKQTAVADFDGDGNLDLAVTADSPDRVHFAFGAGDGTFSWFYDLQLVESSTPSGIVAADIDGDSDVDLVVTLEHFNKVQVLLNTGDGFSADGIYSVGLAPRYLVAALLDDDDTVDLAVSNRLDSTVSVLLNDGEGGFHPQVVYPAGAGTRGLCAIDLDQDGDLDLAAASHDTNEVILFMNNGAGAFTAGQRLLHKGIEIKAVASADLDDDGDNDLVSGGDANGWNVTSVCLQVSPGVFTGPVNYTTNGTGAGYVILADFDLDTDVDVAIANEVTNDFAVLPNSGNGTLGLAINVVTDTRPVHLIGADLDHNGSIDVVSTNQVGDSVSVLINQISSGFTDLGFALAGTNGDPLLAGVGTLNSGTIAELSVSNALANGAGYLILGVHRIDARLAGGTLVPSPDFVLPMLLDGAGGMTMHGIWPGGAAPGDDFYFQAWIIDLAGPHGFAATNALMGMAK